jgi:hypothetical protein
VISYSVLGSWAMSAKQRNVKNGILAKLALEGKLLGLKIIVFYLKLEKYRL